MVTYTYYVVSILYLYRFAQSSYFRQGAFGCFGVWGSLTPVPCPRGYSLGLIASIKDRIGYLLGRESVLLLGGRAQKFLVAWQRAACKISRRRRNDSWTGSAAPASARNTRTYKESLGREEDEVIPGGGKASENIPRISLSLWPGLREKDSIATLISALGLLTQPFPLSALFILVHTA